MYDRAAEPLTALPAPSTRPLRSGRGSPSHGAKPAQSCATLRQDEHQDKSEGSHDGDQLKYQQGHCACQRRLNGTCSSRNFEPTQ